MYKVGMISLGCSKNQVDAERMLALIEDQGMTLENDPDFCDALIVNTCGFIEAAKVESIETILEAAQLKEEGNLRVLAVTGCLAQRYYDEIKESLPEVDVLLGLGSNQEIVPALRAALEDGEFVSQFGENTHLSLEGRRVLLDSPHFSYLKIAEGCDNRCTYCAIPSIRGRFRSRPMERILEEARELAKMGVKELNVVAQDSTRYGEDIDGELKLPQLLEELVKIDGIEWIRVLYCYPERITQELLDVMAREDKIVKYLDIPLQHASNSVLKRMNRVDDIDSTKALLRQIRQTLPESVIRTTLIAGFPGETEDDFQELCEFVEEMRFERLGCFAYSKEEGTPAARLPDQLDEEVKMRRSQVVMDVQMPIAMEFARQQVGKTMDVLVESYDAELEMYVGRSWMDAPDVDTRVYVDRGQVGEFVTVEITHSQDYDLIGKAVNNA